MDRDATSFDAIVSDLRALHPFSSSISKGKTDFSQRPLIVSARGSESRWARYYRIPTTNDLGDETSYFMKVSVGEHGREALRGEFESTAAIRAVADDFTPEPIAYGSFKSLDDTHYYIATYHGLKIELPQVERFCERLAALHRGSESPNGKFGFHVVTYNGNLSQENGYTDTWEEFFTNGFKYMLDLNIDRGGPWEEMEILKQAVLEKVIPRLLRPMETAGRSISPSLVHGDLWCGNTAIDGATDLFLIYGPASFYAHNEYELGNWVPERNNFSRGGYFEAYHSHIPPSEPAQDYDDRKALYSMRFNLHAASLFPETPEYRKLVIDEMERLVGKYPGGYEENTDCN